MSNQQQSGTAGEILALAELHGVVYPKKYFACIAN